MTKRIIFAAFGFFCLLGAHLAIYVSLLPAAPTASPASEFLEAKQNQLREMQPGECVK